MEKSWLIALLLLAVIVSCKKTKSDSSFDLGVSYFPRQTGSWIVYDVDSIVHDDNDGKTGVIDTFRYQLKELVHSEFTDLEGRLSQRIERHTRLNATDDWKIKDVWSSSISSVRAEQQEENVTYIKLVFPPKEGEKWNGNALNSLREWEYEYTEIDASTIINNITLDSVLTVIQQNEQLVIQSEYAEERYAKNIGRVAKTYIFLDIQNEAGVEYYETINSFGN